MGATLPPPARSARTPPPPLLWSCLPRSRVSARRRGRSTRAPAATKPARARGRARHPRPLPDPLPHGGQRVRVPWQVLAAIGAIETDHGRSDAPGVRSGVNRFGCCAGPMQFNLTDGPPSTWQRYGVDGNHDGTTDLYDPADAIPSAANYLRALLARRRRQPQPGDPRLQPLAGLRRRRPRARPRVRGRHRRARRPDALAAAGCAAAASTRPPAPPTCAPPSALTAPRAYRAAAGLGDGRPRARARRRPPLRRRRLDPAPLPPARHRRPRSRPPHPRRRHRRRPRPRRRHHPGDLGRLRRAARPRPRLDRRLRRSGTRPACPLVPAIQFIGYDGYPGHGSPRTCSGALPRPPPRLLGVAAATARADSPAVRVGDGVRRIAGALCWGRCCTISELARSGGSACAPPSGPCGLQLDRRERSSGAAPGAASLVRPTPFRHTFAV